MNQHIEDIVEVEYPAQGWVDNIPVQEVPLINVVRLRIPRNPNYIFRHEVRIRGFINVEWRRWVRSWRRHDRYLLEWFWYDTPEDRALEEISGGPYDIFDLTRLFGMRSYDEYTPEESWV